MFRSPIQIIMVFLSSTAEISVTSLSYSCRLSRSPVVVAAVVELTSLAGDSLSRNWFAHKLEEIWLLIEHKWMSLRKELISSPENGTEMKKQALASAVPEGNKLLGVAYMGSFLFLQWEHNMFWDFKTCRTGVSILVSFIPAGAGDSLVTRNLLGMCWKASLYLRGFTKLIDPGSILITLLYSNVRHCLS